jgi:hypothetical protein
MLHDSEGKKKTKKGKRIAMRLTGFVVGACLLAGSRVALAVESVFAWPQEDAYLRIAGYKRQELAGYAFAQPPVVADPAAVALRSLVHQPSGTPFASADGAELARMLAELRPNGRSPVWREQPQQKRWVFGAAAPGRAAMFRYSRGLLEWRFSVSNTAALAGFNLDGPAFWVAKEKAAGLVPVYIFVKE